MKKAKTRQREHRAADLHKSEPSEGPPRKRRFWFVILAVVGMGLTLAVTLSIWFRTRLEATADFPPPTAALPKTGSNAVRDSNSARNEDVVRRVNQANNLLARGQTPEAVQVLTDAVRLNPEDEDIRYNLGVALARLGKLEESIHQYQEALRLFPNYVEAHNNLGNVLMRAGRESEAVAQFEAALKLMPDYASAHNNLGTALQKSGKTNEAFVQFRQAVQANSNYWEAHFNVAMSCLQAGRLVEARRALETVLRLKPGFQPADAALAEVTAQETAAARPGS